MCDFETKIDANGNAELDIRFPITKVELKRGFLRGTMWIIRPKQEFLAARRKRGNMPRGYSANDKRRYMKMFFEGAASSEDL